MNFKQTEKFFITNYEKKKKYPVPINLKNKKNIKPTKVSLN